MNWKQIIMTFLNHPDIMPLCNVGVSWCLALIELKMLLTQQSASPKSIADWLPSCKTFHRICFVASSFIMNYFYVICYQGAASASSQWAHYRRFSVSFIQTYLLSIFVSLISRVCICGYPRQQMRRYKGINTRLTVTSDFLVQLITGIHYALYVYTQAIIWPWYCEFTDHSASVYTSTFGSVRKKSK